MRNLTAQDSGQEEVRVESFSECVDAGYPVMESYPRQCRTPSGEVFVEDIGNELEKADLIRISSPRPNVEISSPLVVEGEARGYWFFEADFPVRLYDSEGREVAVAIAEAQGDWMTEDFVAYRAELEFDKPATSTGILVLEKDNPSGLSENADELRVPVRFNPDTAEYGEISTCIITGCSGQICAEEEVATTCEYQPEYACYKNATCERQANGECGWTLTGELAQCLGIAL